MLGNAACHKRVWCLKQFMLSPPQVRSTAAWHGKAKECTDPDSPREGSDNACRCCPSCLVRAERLHMQTRWKKVELALSFVWALCNTQERHSSIQTLILLFFLHCLWAVLSVVCTVLAEKLRQRELELESMTQQWQAMPEIVQWNKQCRDALQEHRGPPPVPTVQIEGRTFRHVWSHSVPVCI